MSELMFNNKWEEVQEKAFIRWFNSRIKSHKLATPIKNLSTDLKNGLNLIYLLEELSEREFPLEYFKVCKYEMHCQENISLCLKFLKMNNFRFVNLDFNDIYEGNKKLILGLIWTIIKHYDILNQTSNITDIELKKDLLQWCNGILSHYDYELKNFNSWGSGAKFAALIHSLQRKGAKDFSDDPSLTPSVRVGNAMEIAQENHFIPYIIDPEDLLSGIDVISTMTLIGLIKREYESGPERRAEKRRITPVVSNSRFYFDGDESKSTRNFVIEVRNADDELVPHCNNLANLKVIAKSSPFEGSPFVAHTDIASAENGRYVVSLLVDTPGSYSIKAMFEETEIGSVIEFSISKIASTISGPSGIISKGILSFFTLNVTEENSQKEEKTRNFAKAIVLKYSCTNSGQIMDDKEKNGEEDGVRDKKEDGAKDGEEEEIKSDGMIAINNEFNLKGDGEYVTSFTPTITGEYTVSGTVYGQAAQNTLTFTVEDPTYKLADNFLDKAYAEELSKIVVLSTDSTGNELASPSHLKCFVVYDDEEIEIAGESANDKSKDDDKINSSSLNSIFTFPWTPDRISPYKILVKDQEKVILSKEGVIEYQPSSEQSVVTFINNEEKLFEEISSAKLRIKLKTRSGKNIPGHDLMDSIALKFEKINTTEKADGNIPNDGVFKIEKNTDSDGEYIASFSANIAGEYKLDVLVNNQKIRGESIMAYFKMIPNWKIIGRLCDGENKVEQVIKLINRDEDGNSIPTEANIHLLSISHGISREKDSVDENKVYAKSVGDEKIITWIPSRLGRHEVKIFINDELKDTFIVFIKNQPDLERSTLTIKESRDYTPSEKIHFDIHLRDSNNDLIGTGADEKDLFIGIKEEKLDDKEIDAQDAVPLNSLENNQDGSFSFTVSSQQISNYHIFALLKGKNLAHSPIRVSIVPARGFKTLGFSDLAEIHNDSAFFNAFCLLAENGTLATKFRYHSAFFMGDRSNNILSLKEVESDEAHLVYNKLRIPMVNVSAVVKGKRTQVMKSKVNIDLSRCFSVIMSNRTVDFKMNLEQERDVWVRGLNLVLGLERIRANSKYKHF